MVEADALASAWDVGAEWSGDNADYVPLMEAEALNVGFGTTEFEQTGNTSALAPGKLEFHSATSHGNEHGGNNDDATIWWPWEDEAVGAEPALHVVPPDASAGGPSGIISWEPLACVDTSLKAARMNPYAKEFYPSASTSTSTADLVDGESCLPLTAEHPPFYSSACDASAACVSASSYAADVVAEAGAWEALRRLRQLEEGAALVLQRSWRRRRCRREAVAKAKVEDSLWARWSPEKMHAGRRSSKARSASAKRKPRGRPSWEQAQSDAADAAWWEQRSSKKHMQHKALKAKSSRAVASTDASASASTWPEVPRSKSARRRARSQHAESARSRPEPVRWQWKPKKTNEEKSATEGDSMSAVADRNAALDTAIHETGSVSNTESAVPGMGSGFVDNSGAVEKEAQTRSKSQRRGASKSKERPIGAPASWGTRLQRPPSRQRGHRGLQRAGGKSAATAAAAYEEWWEEPGASRSAHAPAYELCTTTGEWWDPSTTSWGGDVSWDTVGNTSSTWCNDSECWSEQTFVDRHDRAAKDSEPWSMWRPDPQSLEQPEEQRAAPRGDARQKQRPAQTEAAAVTPTNLRRWGTASARSPSPGRARAAKRGQGVSYYPRNPPIAGAQGEEANVKALEEAAKAAAARWQ